MLILSPQNQTRHMHYLNSLTVYFYAFLFTLVLISCTEEGDAPITMPMPLDTSTEPIIDQLKKNYTQLPEQAVTISTDSSVYAQYAMPTDKYGHAILGDGMEAEQLVVASNGKFYDLFLEDDYVFEDIRPRLYDVDNDGDLEIITIRTHTSNGAGIVIYKLVDNKLTEYATVTEIGRRFRWLNIATVDDIDNDGTVEIAWIQTPHIGGILKVAKIEKGILTVLSEKSQYSNHAIGERNLCLSVLSEQDGQKVIYVPNQNRSSITGFSLKNNIWTEFETIDQSVDFSKALLSQYDFKTPIKDQVNCID